MAGHAAEDLTVPTAASAVAPRRDDVLTAFAVLWAAAAFFHLVGGSARALDVLHDASLVGVSHVAVGVAVVLVVVWPRRTAPLVALAVASAVSAWLEAPFLGTHWFAAALIDLGLLAAVLAARRGWRVDRARLQALFVPLARWSLIGFYSWAAFAKLNHGFFDTRYGCGTFYFDELAGSLGAGTPIAVGQHGWAVVVPISVAAIELSIPVLLLVRRTRVVGVVLGLLFHSTIALDQTHLFEDFSSVLLALFTLFLPPAWAAGVVDRWRALAPAARRVLRAVVAAGIGLVLLAQWSGMRSELARTAFEEGRLWLWLGLDGLVLVLVALHLRADRSPAERPMSLSGVPRWLWVVPAVVILNGTAPYLGVRTAYAYNMYANLRTADGDSNHFVIARTLDLAGDQGDLVRITASSDPALRVYIAQRFDLPYLSLRAYLAEHRDVSVTYTRDGVEHRLAHASDEPGLVDPVDPVRRRVFALRAVDQQDPPRCQDVFLPAL